MLKNYELNFLQKNKNKMHNCQLKFIFEYFLLIHIQ